ncbi:hypothetical protein [Polyangium sp. 15x6]|uniref:hypothetical protein n=1 Tax=Polyangium sp. 15x6 TaxID=3042687 RepID=UPI00249B2F30|nr:hypothetical protein [Polyangium sp. 15x6]MDI3288771.1 hypothetical protein [Polyangium sp. 15x6]
MRLSFTLIVLASCGVASCGAPKRAAAPQPDAVRLAEVTKPSEGEPNDVVVLATWMRPAPAVGERWSLVDRDGFLGEVVVRSAIEARCDHCPQHQATAAPEGGWKRPIAGAIAIGPALGPLTKARVTFQDDRWIDAWKKAPEGTFVHELDIDVDGDGLADITRWASGPQVTYELRARVGTTWKVRERWVTPHLLDVEDASPEPPAKNAPQVCPTEPDGDADGIPDRCDACPVEPGMIWDDYPGIDGCPTAVFHSLVRGPEDATRAAAKRKPSPCGRMPGTRILPPPACP